MVNSPLQFPLPLKLDSDASLANFWSQSSSPAVSALKRLLVPEPDREEWLFLAGMEGSGKSHLLQALVQEAQNLEQAALYIDCVELLSVYEESEPDYLESLGEENPGNLLLEGFEHYALLCFDNLQVLASSSEWQQALFYLLVRLKNNTGSRIVFAANNTVDSLGIGLPDLVSRLKSSAQFKLESYTDEDKASILMHRAEAEGIQLSVEVARFIVERNSRDMKSLIGSFKELDRMAMARSRKLTIPFVKEILAI